SSDLGQRPLDQTCATAVRPQSELLQGVRTAPAGAQSPGRTTPGLGKDPLARPVPRPFAHRVGSYKGSHGTRGSPVPWADNLRLGQRPLGQTRATAIRPQSGLLQGFARYPREPSPLGGPPRARAQPLGPDPCHRRSPTEWAPTGVRTVPAGAQSPGRTTSGLGKDPWARPVPPSFAHRVGSYRGSHGTRGSPAPWANN